jgi:hypothetical protein
MNQFTAVLLIVASGLLLAACNTTKAKHDDPNARPAWIDNPGNGVSASAGMHVRGRAAQENLAIFRAREEYAKRFGVTIEAEQTMGTTVVGERASTVAVKASHEEVRQSDIKAQVKAKWRDPNTDVLWIWLVPSNN